MGKDTQHNRGWTFYYDGDCGLCARIARWLSRADLFKRIEWVPQQALARPPRGLTLDDLESAAYLDTGRGQLHEGFYAFKMLALRLTPLLPLAPVLWLPGVERLGVPVYRWVAKTRYRLSRCRIRGPAAGRATWQLPPPPLL